MTTERDRAFEGRRRRQSGNVGELAVMTEFGRLGWGTMENKRDDEGSDIFALAKSADLIGLRQLVGLQVKAGPSYFKSPDHDSDGVGGWWFAEDDESHFDDWINFSVPHLVVLHNLESQESFWAQVTQDRVETTGQGRKIFVPATQQIDEVNREALEAVAKSGRRVVNWEGSAWNKPALSDPKEALRHALLTPRLISPHANANPASETSAAAAVAMLCEGRVDELQRLRLMRPTLDPDQSSWSWKFFAALRWAFLDTNLQPLIDAAMETGRGNVSATAAAAAAGWLTAEGHPDEAIELLEPKLASRRLTQVDRAWLNLQLARARIEVGQIDVARAGARRILAVCDRYPADATASALGAAASILLFNSAPPQEHDLSRVIVGADVAPMWWLTQMEFTGLAAGAKKAFERWCRNDTVTFGGGEPAINKLIASASVSSLLGDQASWTQISGYVGRALLVQSHRPGDEEGRAAGIRTLLSAGEERALTQATQAIVDDGPAVVVRRVASDVELARLTKTTAPGVLGFLQAAGDVLERPTANRVVDWILDTLRDPEEFIQRTTPTYLVYYKLFEVLAAVLPAASPSKRRRVASYLACLEPNAPLPIEVPVLSGLCSLLTPTDWSSSASRRVLRDADEYEEPLRSSIVASAVESTEARIWLGQAISRGEVSALRALGDVRRLTPAEARTMIRLHAASVRKRVKDARGGALSFGGPDACADLVVLNTWHPDQADWPAVTSFLRCQAIPAQSKQPTLLQLGNLFDRVPHAAQGHALRIGRRLLNAPPSDAGSPFEPGREAWGACAALLAAAGEEVHGLETALLTLLSAGVANRQWGLRLAGKLRRAADIGILVAMISDRDPRVRGVAGEQLALLSAAGGFDDIVDTAVTEAARDPGAFTQRFVAAAFASASKGGDYDPSEVAIAALRTLSTGVSAEARGYAAEALARLAHRDSPEDSVDPADH